MVVITTQKTTRHFNIPRLSTILRGLERRILTDDHWHALRVKMYNKCSNTHYVQYRMDLLNFFFRHLEIDANDCVIVPLCAQQCLSDVAVQFLFVKHNRFLFSLR
jgi:hypothetical protein